MKPEHELALENVRADQTRLRRLMRRLDERIDWLAAELSNAADAPCEDQPESAPKAEVEPAVVELPVKFAPLEFNPTKRPLETPQEQPQKIHVDAPIDPTRQQSEAEPGETADEVSDSIEMTFGRVWLVRFGIVILLTGLVFLGNLAYQHIIPRLGPAAKLAMIYLAGFTLGGAGLFLERKRASLRNYARVVLAGGCATIYYATYAAHFVAPLRVIENPVLAGSLLLGLAVGIALTADRRKSETLAFVALVLSYYTSGLNPVGQFTLFSSFLLTGTAIFFLVRHRWVRLTVASLAGTYLSYLWCRFTGHGGAVAGFGFASVAFLSGYWLIFTAGGFIAKRETLGAAARTQFLTANNAAFAMLSAGEILRYLPAHAWAFAVGFGVVLFGLARLARSRFPEGGILESALLIQGFALTTLGLALKLTGQQLALVLAAQSVLLLAGKGPIPWLRLGGAALNAIGAAGLAASGLMNGTTSCAPVGAFVGIALIADAWIYRRRSEVDLDSVSPAALLLTVAAFGLGVGALHQAIGLPRMIGWMAGAAVLTALIPRTWGLRELTLAGQFLLPASTVVWGAMQFGLSNFSRIEPSILIATGIALSLWWSREKRIALGDMTRHILEGGAGVSAAVVAVIWTQDVFQGARGMWAAAVLGSVWFPAAVAVAGRYLALGGLGFSVLAIGKFVSYQASVHWAVAVMPIAHLLIVAALIRPVTRRFGNAALGCEPPITRAAIVVASIMTIAWSFAHIDREWQALFFAFVGALTSIMGATARWRTPSFTGFGLGVFAWILAVVVYQCEPTWQHLAAITLLPAAARYSRKRWAGDLVPGLAAVLTWASMTGITFWTLRWCDVNAQRMGLTVIWTFLALGFFGAGLLLRDRHYRLGGLALLVLSVGRVFFVDVWAFNEVARIVSFIVLGTVLLLVGYFYNRFAENLRRWL